MSVYGKWKWKRLRIIKFEIIFECRFFAFVTVARGTCYASFIGISTGWKENFSLIKRWFFFATLNISMTWYPFWISLFSNSERGEQKTHRNPPQRQWINYANRNSNEWVAVTFFCSFHTRASRDKKAFHFIKRFAIFLIAILIFNLFTTRGSSWVDKRRGGGGGKG